MDLSDLIEASAILPALKANSKKQLLQILSEKASGITGLQEREIFDTILQRERLGSTGVGHGVALPHARIPGITHLFGLFAVLERPIDFGAIDEAPVDLVFLLLVPIVAGKEYLAALAAISRRLRDADTLRAIRAAKEPAKLYEALVR